MEKNANPFNKRTGADKIGSPIVFLGILAGVVLFSLIISKMGIISGLGIIILPFILTYFYLLFRFPIIGVYSAVIFGFVLLGLARYIQGFPIGLVMDAILALTYIALIFSKFYEKVDWTPAKKDVTILALIWFAYSLFQIINPEANSLAAWFSGRGIALYMLMLIPLTLILINTNKKLDILFLIWGAFSILATLKGIMQLKFGVDPWEQMWLDKGNYKTHILFGKLRVFSFFSDAGQFGANQGYCGVVASILVGAQKDWKRKLFFIIVGLLGFYGMLISGTRGSLSVPIAGLGAYFVLRKNRTILIMGFILLLMIIVFFKFTLIGQGNAQIRRMRTAFDPNDASLQVRLANQRKLKSYMASRPFGGGIGHGGVKAQRYLPNAYLSSIPTDSWYVLIWVEQGIVGLLMHLTILFYIVGKTSYNIMFRIRDPIVKLKMSALTAGMFGVMVASYGNAVLGQMPTSILIYISMAVMMNSDKYDNLEYSEITDNKLT